ncbi:MAG: tripartite tricarboxylate transporter TctB family protein [Acidobacteria bacterium]|nr:tripartite tricarboxylate transporter TctB family protein [Acidobacteriota bacterium]
MLAATAGIAPDDLNASSDMAERLPTDWRTLGLMAVALAGLIVLWRPLGFILAAALFVVAGAWVLGSRSPVRDLIVGVLVSVGTFALFTRVLGLELPAGLLAEAIRALTGIVTWLYSRP